MKIRYFPRLMEEKIVKNMQEAWYGLYNKQLKRYINELNGTKMFILCVNVIKEHHWLLYDRN